ncbi:hypothetical protein [Tessaracoccus massiliensis]|uniref:hypothetical protein n=1 Tax=Tessaracoccus massiliensis TaxID=1522311 RepID=UPI000693C47C|nr:hypothetical protein [Tessaracoccus massiliensis]
MSHDWRLAPLALATWSAAWLGTLGWRPERDALIAVFVGLVLLIIVALRGSRLWIATVIGVFTVTLLMSGLQSWQRHTSPLAELAADGAVALVGVRLLAEPQPAERVTVARVEVGWVEARGKRVETRVPVVVLASGGLGAERVRGAGRGGLGGGPGEAGGDAGPGGGARQRGPGRGATAADGWGEL